MFMIELTYMIVVINYLTYMIMLDKYKDLKYPIYTFNAHAHHLPCSVNGTELSIPAQ